MKIPAKCEATNLMAFATEKIMKRYFDEICTEIKISWLCAACARWHAWPKPKPQRNSYRIPARILLARVNHEMI